MDAAPDVLVLGVPPGGVDEDPLLALIVVAKHSRRQGVQAGLGASARFLLQRGGEFLLPPDLRGGGEEDAGHMAGKRCCEACRLFLRPDEYSGPFEGTASRVEAGNARAAHFLDVGDCLVAELVEELVIVGSVYVIEPLRFSAHVLVETFRHAPPPLALG